MASLTPGRALAPAGRVLGGGLTGAREAPDLSPGGDVRSQRPRFRCTVCGAGSGGPGCRP